MTIKTEESLKFTAIDKDVYVDQSGAIFMEAHIPELTILSPVPHIMPNFDGMSRQYITPQQALSLIHDKDKNTNERSNTCNGQCESRPNNQSFPSMQKGI